MISSVASYQGAPGTFADIALVILLTSSPGVEGCGWSNAVRAGLGQLPQNGVAGPEKCISRVPLDEKSPLLSVMVSNLNFS